MSSHDRRDTKPETKVLRKAAAPTAAPATKPAPVAVERQAAPGQINRTLKAWRERGPGGGGGGVKIPSGGGGKLPGSVQKSMEQRLGADLSDVNIHTGGDSAGAAKDLNARAFTTGTDVHFGAGEFNPGSKEGNKLLAHELTHVVQAKRSGISRSEEAPEDNAATDGEKGAEPTGEKDGEQLEVSDPEEPAEKEADEVAEKVTAEDDGSEGKGEPATDGAEEKPTEISAKSIPISAKLKGIGLKVFRSTPPPAPGGGGAADPQAAEAKAKAQDFDGKLRAAFGGGAKASSAELAALLMAPDINQLVRANPSVKEVQDLKQFVEIIRDSVEDACQADITEFRGRLTGLSPEADDAAAQLTALKSDPKYLAWKNNPLVGLAGKEPSVFVMNIQSEFPKKEGEIRKAAHDKEMLALSTAAASANAPQGGGPTAEKQKELLYKKDLIKLKSQELAMSADFYQKLVDIGAGIGIDIVSETTIDAAVAAIVAALTVKFPGIGALSAIPAFALSFAAKQAVKTVISGAGVDGLNMALEKIRGKRLDARMKAVDTLSDAELDELAAALQTDPSECFDKLDKLGKERVKMEQDATTQAAPKAAEEDEKHEDGVVKKLGKEAGKRALYDAAGELMKKIFVPFASIAEKAPEVLAKLNDVKKVMGELKLLRAEIKAIEDSLKEMASNPPPAAS